MKKLLLCLICLSQLYFCTQINAASKMTSKGHSKKKLGAVLTIAAATVAVVLLAKHKSNVKNNITSNTASSTTSSQLYDVLYTSIVDSNGNVCNQNTPTSTGTACGGGLLVNSSIWMNITGLTDSNTATALARSLFYSNMPVSIKRRVSSAEADLIIDQLTRSPLTLDWKPIFRKDPSP